MNRIIFILTLITFLPGVVFSQAIPKQISYQGILKDVSGNTLTGDFSITFKIYNDPTGGTALWSEIQSVSVANGLFSVQIGSITPITTVPFDRIHFLGITVGTESELTPRTLLSPSPYSFMSMNVLDNTITTGKIQDGAVTNLKIASNEVVKGLNGLKDNVNLVAGSNITITPSGNDLTISATGGGGGGTVTQVNTGAGLTGGPITTTGTISIANDGITNSMLQNNSVTSSKIVEATITTNDLSDNAITTSKIADNTITALDLSTGSVTSDEITDGTVTTTDILNATITATDIANTQVVKSLNTLKDNVTLVAGSNITITPSGQNLTIASTAGGIGGSGNANYLPLFTGATTLGNSVIYQTGGNIGIGTTTPGAKLELYGGDALINGLTVGRGAGGPSGFSENSAFGYQSLYSNSGGSRITCIGNSTLYSNTYGNDNTATGYMTLRFNTVGSYNTANGSSALYSNTTGDNNSANGYKALYFNTTGHSNTANGYRALYSNTIGNYNTANGYQSLYLNTTGYYNTADGYQALHSNTTAYRNTADGYQALYSNTTGGRNTADGYRALYFNTIENGNTGVGCNAGDNYTASNSTFIGYNSYPNANGYSNVMGLGYNTRLTATDQVRIGNSTVASIGGYAGWTNLSDGRYKTSIQENVKGLDFVMKLRPVTYRLDVNRLAADLKEDQKRDENGNIITSTDQTDINSRNEKSQIVYTGFVAQEVEKAANEIGFDFSGIDAPKNENDFYGLRYAEFVVPLVKAVQEQQKIIEELTRRIEELEKK